MTSAATTEFRNQRNTGVCAVGEKIVSNASVVHSLAGRWAARLPIPPRS
jgi:hypothetical protein